MSPWKTYLSRLIRVLVAGVLLWAAWKKFAIPPGQLTMYDAWVAAYPLLRFALPTTEAVLAVWLATGWHVRVPATIALVMLLTFSMLVAAETTKPIPSPCGCLETPGTIETPDITRHGLLTGLARNVAMIAGLGYLLATGTDERARP